MSVDIAKSHLAVHFAMCVESGGPGEALVASCALIWPLSSVPPHMNHQLLIGVKCFITQFAAVWFLARVPPHVDLHMYSFSKLSATIFASEALLGRFVVLFRFQ